MSMKRETPVKCQACHKRFATNHGYHSHQTKSRARCWTDRASIIPPPITQARPSPNVRSKSCRARRSLCCGNVQWYAYNLLSLYSPPFDMLPGLGCTHVLHLHLQVFSHWHWDEAESCRFAHSIFTRLRGRSCSSFLSLSSTLSTLLSLSTFCNTISSP